MSWLQSQKIEDLKLRTDYYYLICDALAIEANKKDDPSIFLEKIAQLIDKNKKNVIFGNPLGFIFHEEKDACIPMGTEDCLNAELFTFFQNTPPTLDETRKAVVAKSSTIDEHNQGSSNWVANSVNYADIVNSFFTKDIDKKSFRQLANTPEIERLVIQQDDAPWKAFANTFANNPDWKRRLTGFPDIWKSGLIGRLHYYCAIQTVLGRTKQLENNYEDIEYAFYACHTNAIASRDKNLIRMIDFCSGIRPLVHRGLLVA